MTVASRRALYVAAGAGLACAAAALVGAAALRHLWFDPVTGQWTVGEAPPSTVAMDYYGRVFFSLAAGMGGGAATFGIASRRTVSDTLLRASAAWGIALTLFGIAYYVWTFSHRTVGPPRDLPAGSVPAGDGD